MNSNKVSWFTRAITNNRPYKEFFEPIVQTINPNWQASGYAARIMGKRNESDDVFTLIIKPAKNWPTFEAGQYLSIQVAIKGVRYHRMFSISSSPQHHQKAGLIELTIRKQEHGKVTNWMDRTLKADDPIRLGAPQGVFTLSDSECAILMIAGGSGITPFRSMINDLAANNSSQDVHLIYYNDKKTPLFKQELEKLQSKLSKFSVDFIDTEQAGLISAEQLTQHCTDLIQRQVYICGPHGLITTARDILLQLGVDQENINHELFGPKPVSKYLRTEGNVYFKKSDTRISSPLGKHQTLLELAEQAKTKPQSGCRMGVCHQCKCKKQQGVVYNTLTDSYSDTGEENIQLCVSIPVGEVTLEL